MASINLTIPGEPTGKGRHRTTKTGHTYTPEKTRSYEKEVQTCYQMDYMGKQLLEGELIAEIDAYFKIPKSATKGKRLAMKNNVTRPTKKPDMSNIIKIIEDALNKVAYKDDSQIVEVIGRKWWTLDNPRVEVLISEVR